MITNIQALRAFAVILVVLNHAAQQSARIGSGALSFETGAAGVDVFFVISAFIMCHITASGTTIRRFLLSRFLRVAPTYYIVTAFMIAIVALAPHLFNTSTITLYHIIASFLFVAWPHPIMHDAIPLYLPGRTLNYEFFFYVTFSIFLAFRLLQRIAATSLILMLLVCARPLIASGAITEFYTNSILLEFVFGMIVYHCANLGFIRSPRVAGLMLMASALLLFVIQYAWPTARGLENRCLVWGIPAAALVYSAITLEQKGYKVKNRLVLFIGDASYAVYLTHLFTIGFVALLWRHVPVHGIIPDICLMGCCLIASIAAGSAFHLMLERPLAQLTHKWLRNKSRAALSSVGA